MELTILYIFSTVLFVLAISLACFTNRICDVIIFRYELFELSKDYARRRIYELDDNCWKVYDWFFNKYSYRQMLFSFKPLNLKSWYTEEEINEIKR